MAGTTIEIILSNFLSNGDLATPIEDYEEPIRKVQPGVLIQKISGTNRFGLPTRLRDHSSLEKAFSVLNPKVKEYFIVTACRNPWDRAVSQFYWSYRKKNILSQSFKTQKREFNKFVRVYGPKTWLDLFYGRKKQRRLNSSHLYTINNNIHLNFVVRYENLKEDLSELIKVLNLKEKTIDDKLSTKSSFRSSESRQWQDLYECETIEIVANCCRQEIDCFNYNFDGTSQPQGGLFNPLSN